MHRSGREPYRVVCGGCGANYYVVMQLVEVAPSGDTAIPSLESELAGRNSRTT